MLGMFSTGVCFWFIVLRDYLLTFLAFTFVSIHFFNLAAVANQQANTSQERLNGISRASLGAILLWGDAKSKAGLVTDSDRNNALAAVCLDTFLMLALTVITLYHYWKKEAVRKKAWGGGVGRGWGGGGRRKGPKAFLFFYNPLPPPPFPPSTQPTHTYFSISTTITSDCCFIVYPIRYVAGGHQHGDAGRLQCPCERLAGGCDGGACPGAL